MVVMTPTIIASVARHMKKRDHQSNLVICNTEIELILNYFGVALLK